MGRGRGQGFGRGQMGGSKPGSGPGGYCVCPECGAKTPHQVGVPCYSIACSHCGAKMIKE